MTTTLLAGSDAFVGAEMRGVSWDSHNLLDRFWDAVVVPPSEPVNIRDSFCSFEETAYEASLLQTPEIFAKSGSNPVINVKALRHSVSNGNDKEDPSLSPILDAVAWSPPFPPRRILRLNRARLEEPPQITFQPATPSYLPNALVTSTTAESNEPKKPRLSIPSYRHRQISGISSPGSALLAMASNFLNTIVRLGRSQSSTPAPRVWPDNIRIVDSEILISVVDDAFRGRSESANGYRDSDGIDWLESAPSSSIYTPLPNSAQGNSAEEMDILAKLNWEMQLINAQQRQRL